jgi:hypothetical protein
MAANSGAVHLSFQCQKHYLFRVIIMTFLKAHLSESATFLNVSYLLWHCYLAHSSLSLSLSLTLTLAFSLLTERQPKLIIRFPKRLPCCRHSDRSIHLSFALSNSLFFAVCQRRMLFPLSLSLSLSLSSTVTLANVVPPESQSFLDSRLKLKSCSHIITLVSVTLSSFSLAFYPLRPRTIKGT